MSDNEQRLWPAEEVAAMMAAFEHAETVITITNGKARFVKLRHNPDAPRPDRTLIGRAYELGRPVSLGAMGRIAFAAEQLRKEGEEGVLAVAGHQKQALAERLEQWLDACSKAPRLDDGIQVGELKLVAFKSYGEDDGTYLEVHVEETTGPESY